LKRLLQNVSQDIARLVFHALPMTSRTRLKPLFQFIVNIADRDAIHLHLQ
jgi:hypothetical protein